MSQTEVQEKYALFKFAWTYQRSFLSVLHLCSFLVVLLSSSSVCNVSVGKVTMSLVEVVKHHELRRLLTERVINGVMLGSDKNKSRLIYVQECKSFLGSFISFTNCILTRIILIWQ